MQHHVYAAQDMGWELNVCTCGWGSCFALPLGQRPKDTARTERKPNTQIREIQKGKAHAGAELRPLSPYTVPPQKVGREMDRRSSAPKWRISE